MLVFAISLKIFRAKSNDLMLAVVFTATSTDACIKINLVKSSYVLVHWNFALPLV